MIDAKQSSFRIRLALQTMLVAGLVIAGFGIWAWWFARGEQALNHDLRIMQEARQLWLRLAPRDDVKEIAQAVSDIFGKDRSTVAVTVVWHAEGNTIATLSGPKWEDGSLSLLKDRLPTGSDVITRRLESGEAQRQARARFPEASAAGVLRRPVMPEIREPRFFRVTAPEGKWRYGIFSNPHYTLFFGRSEAALESGSRRAALWFSGAGLLALVLAGLGAWWTSGRATRPLQRIVATSRRMSAGNLDERIPMHAGDDREFAVLIAALNDMTERLRESFTQAARFTADASHELRTPLAVMQNTLNETLRAESLDEIARERISLVIHQASRLKHITHSLLLLSQSDAGELPVHRERYDLSKDLEALMEDAESLCETAGLTFQQHIESGVHVEADRALMHQVFQNLLSNAVKHNQPNGSVNVKLRSDNKGVIFQITNTSAEIHPEVRSRLFDRFYRAEASRRSEGFGLGLNIAQELAVANGALLELLDSENGITSFALTFQAQSK
jgi:two-component system, OmpR family, heavy metal sensor histidine kinase CusS